ncbi:hypothetical protein D0C36_03110 [Mucilaginibacter conchicola]|uniref:DUF4625 domain-containing protein n=1 Tax=Mucilaginibacter conchicola TaxID=2303333 RepID=A0A372NWR7_9SPHI|nr:hypothetical protein [Mucilaginibacter conchicola]RFZ94550.1 hypothetical protein D0C36_03110 [Mucilaginibacter conchicola]
MKKNFISYIMMAVVTLFSFSCKKDLDIAGLEKNLPAISVSNLGLAQSGPFNATDVVNISFGATTTNTKPGKFKVEVLRSGSPATLVGTVNFDNWNGKDATNTHSITFNTVPTTYPNTTVYNGTLSLKLSAVGVTAASIYNIKVTAYTTDDNVSSALTQSSLIVTK